MYVGVIDLTMHTEKPKMTGLLKEAFDRASELPPEDQEVFARLVLSELESEAKWADLFAKSQNVLDELADEALKEFEAGKTVPLDPDTL